MLFAIVSYDDTKEIEFVPLKWVVGGFNNYEIGKAVEMRERLTFYWPPWRSQKLVSKAIRDCEDPGVEWPQYTGRILSTAETESEAQVKCKCAELTSSIDKIYGKRTRKQRYRYEDDSDCSVENNVDECIHVKSKDEDVRKRKLPAVRNKPLPIPPVALTQPGDQIMPVMLLRVDHTRPFASILSSAPNTQSTVEENQEDSVIHHVLGNNSNMEPDDHIDANAVPVSEGPVVQLLQQIMTSVQEIQETLKVHTLMIDSISRQLSTTNAPVAPADLPDGLSFPICTMDKLNKTEEILQDAANKQIMVNVLAKIGGNDLKDYIKRTMRFLLSEDLARNCNLTGQNGKRAFKKLVLFEILFMAVETNIPTKSCSRKLVENELKTWFGNSRDRGHGRRLSKYHRLIIPDADLNTDTAD